MFNNTRGFKQLAALISTALSGEKPKSTYIGAGTQRAYARRCPISDSRVT
jgi:hypothetical protein